MTDRSDEPFDFPTGGALDWYARSSEADGPGAGDSVGRYLLVEKAGEGGMGVVWKARDQRLERTVALKTTLLLVDDSTQQRFLQEARAAAALSHPNIVPIFDFGDHDGAPFLVMEWVSGGNLEERPPASLEEALRVARQIAAALEHAHARGIVHRDLKPSNVLVANASAEGSSEAGIATVRLTDLGIALARGAARITATGAIAGTPTFMAPEQALGQDLDGRADLYSLGAMLYLWIVGRPPFQGDDALSIVSQHVHAPVVPPSSLRPDVPPALDALILRLLAKRPAERIESASALLVELDRVSEALGESALTPVSTLATSTLGGLVRGRMVGRTRALGDLLALFRHVERPQIAVIAGEAGIGKSRLAREVAAAAQMEGAPVLAGDCYENEAVLPYLPFVQALGKLAREAPPDRLEELVGDTAPVLSRLAPEIEARLGPFDLPASVVAAEERIRLLEAVARLLRKLASHRRLLLYLDDMQWADHGTIDLLQAILKHDDLGPILVLATYRDAEVSPQHPFGRALLEWESAGVAHRFGLERLGPDETADLVRTLLDQRDLSGELLLSVHRETEGNPFFVEEIVKSLIAEGRLVRHDLAWQHRKTGSVPLPRTLKAAISIRLARVSEPCLEALKRAAVLGKVFGFEELISVCDQEEDALIDAIDEATAAQLLSERDGGSYAFSHDKIREVLYEELNPIRRRRAHARIARGLLELREKDPRVRVEDLAFHFVASGDHENGYAYAHEAAAAAEKVHAYREAVEMLEKALACARALGDPSREAETELRLACACYDWGEIQTSLEHFERAIVLEPQRLRLAEIQAKAAEVYATVGDLRGRDLAEQALATLDPATHPVAAALATAARARYLHLAGRLREGAAGYREALEWVAGTDEHYLVVRLQSFLAGSHQHLAEFEESDAAANAAIEIGEREGIQIGRAYGHEFLNENAVMKGQWLEAIRHGEIEEEIAKTIQAGERVLWSHYRAFALLPLGRLEEAEQMFRSGLQQCETLGENRLAFFLRAGLGVCAYERGDLEEARRRLERVASEVDALHLIGLRILARAFLAPVLLRSEPGAEVARAATEANLALDLVEQTSSDGLFLNHLGTLLEPFVAPGRRDSSLSDERILELLGRHEELAQRHRAVHRLGENQRLRALLHLSRDGRDDALSRLGEAVESFRDAHSALDLARVLALRHAIAGATEDLDTARSVLAPSGIATRVLDREGLLLRPPGTEPSSPTR